MDKQAAQWIAAAEEKWLDELEAACRDIFCASFLPSHNHLHHRRVWYYSKMIIGELQGLGAALDYALVEGALHGAWFHDAGMALDPGPVHGDLGADLYLGFLKHSGEQAPAMKADILDGIRRHDDKERVEEAVFKSGESPRLLQLLSVADDLDALGLCGIYRYAEIYLMRATRPEDLGLRILDNAAIRYRNLCHSCMNMPGLLQRIRTAYEELRTFYTEYNGQLRQSLQEAESGGGALQKIAYIRKMSLESKEDPADFVHLLAREGAGEGAGEALLSWFKKLTHALENPEL